VPVPPSTGPDSGTACEVCRLGIGRVEACVPINTLHTLLPRALFMASARTDGALVRPRVMSLSVLLAVTLSLLAVVLALATAGLIVVSTNASAPAILALAISSSALRAAVVALLVLALLGSVAFAFMPLLFSCHVTRHVASWTPFEAGLLGRSSGQVPIRALILRRCAKPGYPIKDVDASAACGMKQAEFAAANEMVRSSNGNQQLGRKISVAWQLLCWDHRSRDAKAVVGVLELRRDARTSRGARDLDVVPPRASARCAAASALGALRISLR